MMDVVVSAAASFILGVPATGADMTEQNRFKSAFVSYVVVERIALQHGSNGTGSALAKKDYDQGRSNSAASLQTCALTRETPTPSLLGAGDMLSL
jgi:hypothetical protein